MPQAMALAPVPMIPLRSPDAIRTPTALALGSFDGLHAGHRRVIAQVTEDVGGAIPTVASFWPHPREVLFDEVRLRLHLPQEKLHLLAPLGIQQLVLLPFDRRFARLSPEDFVEQVLVQQMRACVVAVGENFRFGAGRCGDARLLRQLGGGHGVQVRVAPLLSDGCQRISSSRIRSALEQGQLDKASQLMPHPYRLRGRVVAGRGLGRELGWPTANLQVNGRKFLPREGVYACWVRLGGEGPFSAVMNLGPQPTVDPAAPSAVEVHLLDRTMTLNGLELEVEPVRFLRSQQTFQDLDHLSAQIGWDAQQARQALLPQVVG